MMKSNKKMMIFKNQLKRIRRKKAKRLWLKHTLPNIQVTTNKSLNTTYQRMLETIQTLTTITNKEMSIQLDTNMIRRTKPITKMLPCNQVMASTQLCSLKVNQDMIFQRMLRTYLTLIITTNREMFYLLDTSMTHKAKLTLKTMLCNQVIATDIQSCSLKISTTFL